MLRNPEYHRFNPTNTEFWYPNVFPATADSVSNTPLWRNTDYPSLTFEDIEQWGCFLSPHLMPGRTSVQVGLRSFHWRSCLINSAQVDPGMPKYIDQKGGGFINAAYRNESYTIVPKTIERDEKRGHISGIFERERAYCDIDYTSSAQLLGIRTVPILGLSQLEEIFYNGQTLRVSEAKDRGLIPHELEPVLMYRGYDILHRLVDLCMYDEKPFPLPHRPLPRVMETYMHLFYDLNKQADIREAVGEDLFPTGYASMIDDFHAEGQSMYESITQVLEKVGWDNLSQMLPVKPYLQWLLNSTWKNYALMHFADEPFVHGFATIHNNTADGKVLDFDGRKAVKNAYDHAAVQEYEVLEKSIAPFLMTVSELFGIPEGVLQGINTQSRIESYFLHKNS